MKTPQPPTELKEKIFVQFNKPTWENMDKVFNESFLAGQQSSQEIIKLGLKEEISKEYFLKLLDGLEQAKKSEQQRILGIIDKIEPISRPKGVALIDKEELKSLINSPKTPDYEVSGSIIKRGKIDGSLEIGHSIDDTSSADSEPDSQLNESSNKKVVNSVKEALPSSVSSNSICKKKRFVPKCPYCFHRLNKIMDGEFNCFNEKCIIYENGAEGYEFYGDTQEEINRNELDSCGDLELQKALKEGLKKFTPQKAEDGGR